MEFFGNIREKLNPGRMKYLLYITVFKGWYSRNYTETIFLLYSIFIIKETRSIVSFYFWGGVIYMLYITFYNQRNK